MASDPITFWDNQTFNAPASVPVNEQIVLASSAAISNGPTPREGLSLHIVYHSIVPNITDGQPSFTIGLVVEQEDPTGRMGPIAYQFTPFRNMGTVPERKIIMTPGMSTFSTGIDDSLFPVEKEVGRISRQQGVLLDKPFRVSLLLLDKDPLGANPFQSITVSVSGERFDA